MKPADQTRVKALRQFYAEHKRLPSYAEMLGLFSVRSKNAIYRLVQRLVEVGVVVRDAAGKLAPGAGLIGTPVIGHIQAGFPSPAEEELADAITIDDYLITNRTSSFLLRVIGDSMIGAGINQNDLVIVERSRTPRMGDIVVAQVDQEWTIKRLAQRNHKKVLLPANPKYQAIYPKTELRIEGVVVGVVRKYY